MKRLSSSRRSAICKVKKGCLNPWYHEVKLPESGWADELTLPDIYGTFFYRRTFTLDRVRAGVLCFEGVRNQVAVWLNGAHLAFRQGFSTPFEFSVPPKMLRVGTNEIVLAVSNNPNLGYLGAYVSGLTTRSLWRSTGGVNGSVALRFPSHDLRRAYVTTAADLGSFTVHLPDATPVDYAVVDPADGRTLLAGTGRASTACRYSRRRCRATIVGSRSLPTGSASSSMRRVA